MYAPLSGIQYSRRQRACTLSTIAGASGQFRKSVGGRAAALSVFAAWLLDGAPWRVGVRAWVRW